jgi:class 3 adenylate cyclase/tetratricopeptide (TPR) repeat protein
VGDFSGSRTGRTLRAVTTCPSCGSANPEHSRFCWSCGTPLQAPPAPTGQRQSTQPIDETRKVVTVLFADVAGSTAVGERLDPESLRRVMTRQFDEIRRTVEEHGGVVEKFIGDAVMAVFGVPRVHEDDAMRAVRAGLAVRDRLAEFDGELRERLGVAIGWRIGVNTGQVVAGDAGAGQRFVSGDAVNLAKRLEEAAGTGEVLIGGETYRLVRDAVTVEPIDALMVKGKAEPIRAYRLMAVAQGATGTTRRADAPMVGRTRQHQLLADAFAQTTADRMCHLFTILGAAGVGKSRLVNEFLSGLQANVRLLRGRCLSYGQGITFWPIREMVHAAAGIADDDPPASAREKIAAILDEPTGGDVQRIVDRVSETIGLVEGAPNPEETLWAARRFFEGLAADRPLVLLFDDVHWAEPGLLDLIEHIADWSRDVAILLLCVGRQELLQARTSWGGGKLAATTLHLEPLSAAESDELVGNLLGEADLETGLRRRITEAADGNPLFVEELLGMLIDDGTLVRSNGSWVAARDLERIRVPPTIQALLAARLDLLSRPERSVMECGAVEGKVFHASAVAALVPDSVRPEVPSQLLGLMRKELLRPDRPEFTGDEAYRFRHLLIRDAAYDAMPKQSRAELHERFAAWLETASGDRRTEYEEILGHHLEQAFRYRSELVLVDDDLPELARRAAEFLGSAGSRALDRGDFAGARPLLERAVELIGGDARRPQLVERLGEVLLHQYELHRARARLEEAIALFRDRSDDAGAARAEVKLLTVRTALESLEVDEVIARGRELIPILEASADEVGWAEAIDVVGANLFFSGRISEAERLLSTTAAQLPAGSRARAIAGRWLNSCWLWGPTPVLEAIERMRREQEEPGNDLVRAASGHRGIGVLLSMIGEFDEARTSIARGDAMAKEIGMRQLTMSTGAHSLGPVERRAGNFERALDVARESYEAMAATGDLAFSSTSAGIVAAISTDLGRWDDAERYGRIALDTSAESDQESQALGRQALALVMAHRGQLQEAQRLASEAVAVRERTDALNGHADALVVLAEVRRLSGAREDAAAALESAIRLYRQKGNLVDQRAAERKREALQ